MANQGVTGRIVDADTSAGVPNLTVEVYDVDTLSPDDWLGQATTDNNGAFSVNYSPSDYGWGLEKQPDLLVRIYDSVKRLIKVDGPHNNVTDTTLALTDIPIKRADYEGWLVTLGNNGTPAFLSQGNDASLLIDNELAWQDVTDAIHNGHTDVHLILLMLHVKKLFTEFSPAPSVGQPATGSRIEDEIVQGASGTMVGRLVIHESVMWPFPPDTEGDVESYYEKGPPHDVKVRPFKFWPGHYMHAKNVIVDGQTGYVVGSPFIQEYFDGRDHQIDDMRRGSWYFMWNFIRTPVHDVSVKLTGPVVVDLANNSFRLHWNQVKTEDPVAALPAPNPAPSGAIGMQLTRTLCGKTFTGMQTGETGILESYQRAFRNAEDFIYIENQYFTSEDIIDSLYLTVQQKPSLQVVLLLNFTVDAPGYNHFQCRAISRLWDKLKDNPADASRVELFTLWSHEQARTGDSDTRSRIIRTYIHSKTSRPSSALGRADRAEAGRVHSSQRRAQSVAGHRCPQYHCAAGSRRILELGTRTSQRRYRHCGGAGIRPRQRKLALALSAASRSGDVLCCVSCAVV